MAARHEHIQALADEARIRRAAIGVDGRLSEAERAAALARDVRETAKAVARYKAAEHYKVLDAFALPHVIELSGGRAVTIGKLTRPPDDDYLEIFILWTKNGATQPFDNPWRIVNPPLLVADPAGDVELVGLDADGNEERRRYREDPLAVLVGLMERKLR
jgi:hypothetical protein